MECPSLKVWLNEVSKDDEQTICSKTNRMIKISEAYLEHLKILDDEIAKELAYMFDIHKNILIYFSISI